MEKKRFAIKKAKGDMLFVKLGHESSAPDFHCYLAHEWATSHEKVKSIRTLLENEGLRVWLNEHDIETRPPYVFLEGLNKSNAVLVFITKMYFEIVQDSNSKACRELTSAVSRPDGYVIPVVLEKEFRNVLNWPPGMVSDYMKDSIRFHLTNLEEIRKSLPKLADHIKALNALPGISLQKKTRNRIRKSKVLLSDSSTIKKFK